MTVILEEEKLGRNSNGNRCRDSQPMTKTPMITIVMVTFRSTAKRTIGWVFLDIVQ